MRLKICAFSLDWSLIISAVPSSHLLSHEVQPALQGVGHFNLPVAVVDLHASGTECQKTPQKTNKYRSQFETLQLKR